MWLGSVKAYILKRPACAGVLRVLWALGTVLCGFLMLEVSSISSVKHLFAMPLRYILLNLATVGIVFSGILMAVNRVWLATVVTSLVCGLTALINHYVLMYHGMPLSFPMLRNFSTAMNVASSYSLSLDKVSAVLLGAMAVMVLLGLLLKKLVKESPMRRKARWLRNGILLLASVGVLYFGYFSPNPVKPPRTNTWLWKESYQTYGYAASTIESFTQTRNAVNEPEGYSPEALPAMEPESPAGTRTPDVILILNESFYDLRQVMDLQTDVPCMPNLDTMENLARGWAVVPSSGGGTNSSEYELLTSNSMQLMPGITPFFSLDLSGANSIVSVLNSLGYTTLGSHAESGANYARTQGYALLGFDKTCFEADFLNKEFYYTRRYETDACVYGNLLRWYEQMPEDAPRFLYTLTIQNHGAWTFDDASHDTVHVLGDYGEDTEPINEYLTGIQLSDLAFRELTEYFAGQERPVIVCMMGDHCPSLAEDHVDARYTGLDRELRLRQVPLYMWANFPLKELDLGTVSMNYVVPMLLEQGDMAMTPYYRYLLQLKERVPVLTAMGYYRDAEGIFHAYDAPSENKALVDGYFRLEYNNLSDHRQQSRFVPAQ